MYLNLNYTSKPIYLYLPFHVLLCEAGALCIGIGWFSVFFYKLNKVPLKRTSTLCSDLVTQTLDKLPQTDHRLIQMNE